MLPGAVGDARDAARGPAAFDDALWVVRQSTCCGVLRRAQLLRAVDFDALVALCTATRRLSYITSRRCHQVLRSTIHTGGWVAEWSACWTQAQ